MTPDNSDKGPKPKYIKRTWVEQENGSFTVKDEEVDVTPNDKLRSLIEEWQENAKDAPEGTLGNVGKLTYQECADELERLIEGNDD